MKFVGSSVTLLSLQKCELFGFAFGVVDTGIELPFKEPLCHTKLRAVPPVYSSLPPF